MLCRTIENVDSFEHLSLDFDSQSCVRVVNNHFAEETVVENYFSPGLYISMLGMCRCETLNGDEYERCDYSYQYIVASVEQGISSKLLFPSNSDWQTFSIMLPLNQFRDYTLPQLKDVSWSSIREGRLAESGPIPIDILKCCEAVWQCNFEGMERELFIKAKALEVLSLFLHKRHEKTSDPLTLRTTKLSNALNHIQTHLADDWSLSAVARLAGSNPTYVKQDIKNLVGISFGEWLKQVRLESAREQLAMEESITQIAHNIGFKSQAHFATLFKGETGMSPSEYRRSLAIHNTL
ncbi:AraC family transcriptional regulator [Marinomonas sp.]|nr:AraC family transcriptional regulator [Marinomonas sp.]MDB4837194.1 AraC family transcriptional regulator [Marinomonas sp.]